MLSARIVLAAWSAQSQQELAVSETMVTPSFFSQVGTHASISRSSSMSETDVCVTAHRFEENVLYPCYLRQTDGLVRVRFRVSVAKQITRYDITEVVGKKTG
jgi:hypothetical protein